MATIGSGPGFGAITANWGIPRPITRPTGNVGGALLQSTKAPTVPTGSGALGVGGRGAGTANPATGPVTAPPPAAPAAPVNPVTASIGAGNNAWESQLTPDQLGALNTLQNNTQGQINDWGQKESDAGNAQQVADDQANWNQTVSNEQANDAMASRGMLVSGLHDSDLADVARTHTLAINAATSAYNTLMSQATNAIQVLNQNWGSAVTQYQGDAGQNWLAAQTAPAAAPAAPAAPAPAPANAPATAQNVQATRQPVSTAGQPAGGKPQTIIQRALAGHPNWRG